MLQAVVDTHDQPFMVIDATLTIVAANHSCAQLLGVAAGVDGLVGRACHEVLHGSSEPCAAQAHCPHRRLLQDLTPYNETMELSIGGEQSRMVKVRGYPIVAADGKVLAGEQLIPLPGPMRSTTIIGKSAGIQRLLDQLARTAQTDLPVLLLGETGTGKELAAQYLHSQSRRQTGPFVTVDCTTLGEQIFEAELFGYEKGAFTGASGRKRGLFELADGGTLFLDEVGELPLSLQPKLLRALDTGGFRRVGGTEQLNANVRLVCATHRDLEAMSQAGEFRADLYYRIRVARLRLPPLRERREDLPLLIDHFLSDLGERMGAMLSISKDALRRLLTYDFPGNVRELRNVLQLGAALAPTGEIGLADIDSGLGSEPAGESEAEPAGAPAASSPPASETTEAQPAASPLQAMEANYIKELLQQEAGDRGRVAELLGVSRRTLQRRIKRYGLS